MAEPSPPKEEAKEAKEDDADRGWKSWVRDIAIAVLIMAIILGGIYLYTGVWPPLVVVESSSMQHSHTTSYIGVIDTGDLVFVKAVGGRSDITTYLQGRASGYSTYGDYGDVIIFRLAQDPSATPIIHRAIMYVIPNGTCGNAICANVPDLALLPPSQWEGYRNGVAVSTPYGLTSVTIHEMGWQHNLGITFNLAGLLGAFPGQAGYVTMGDNNAYDHCMTTQDPCSMDYGPPYDTGWFPAQGDVIGVARGEIPWFGLLKLVLSPAPGCAPQGWGDPCAPANSWTDLAISIVFLIALPFIVEAAAWGWGKYAWPWLKPRLRFRKRKEGGEPPSETADEEPEGPTKGSSGP